MTGAITEGANRCFARVSCDILTCAGQVSPKSVSLTPPNCGLTSTILRGNSEVESWAHNPICEISKFSPATKFFIMKKQISISFNFGDEVALKTEPSVRRIVTGIVLRPSGKMYEIAVGVETSWHQDVELEKFPVQKKSGFR